MRLSKQGEHAQIEENGNYHYSMCCEFVDCVVLLICERVTFMDVVDDVLLLILWVSKYSEYYELMNS